MIDLIFLREMNDCLLVFVTFHFWHTRVPHSFLENYKKKNSPYIFLFSKLKRLAVKLTKFKTNLFFLQLTSQTIYIIQENNFYEELFSFQLCKQILCEKFPLEFLNCTQYFLLNFVEIWIYCLKNFCSEMITVHSSRNFRNVWGNLESNKVWKVTRSL